MGRFWRSLNPNFVLATVVTLFILLMLGWFAWPTRYAYFGGGFFRRDRITGCIEQYVTKPVNGSSRVGWVGLTTCRSAGSLGVTPPKFQGPVH